MKARKRKDESRKHTQGRQTGRRQADGHIEFHSCDRTVLFSFALSLSTPLSREKKESH